MGILSSSSRMMERLVLECLYCHRFQSADIYQVHGVTNTLGVPSAMITSFAGGNPSQPKWFTFINVSATPSRGETGRKQRGELENQLYGRRIPRPLAYLVSGAGCRGGLATGRIWPSNAHKSKSLVRCSQIPHADQCWRQGHSSA